MSIQASPPCVAQKWFGVNHHMFTRLMVADLHRCPKWCIFLDFLHTPLLRKGGFYHPFCTLFAPFVHCFCGPLSALRAPSCTHSAHLLYARTPFMLGPPLCTLCAGGFRAKAFCTKGTKCIHQVQMWFLTQTCIAFFFGSSWLCQGQASAEPLGVRTARQGSPCSKRARDHVVKRVGGGGTAHACRF